jgi:hypothetical protein
LNVAAYLKSSPLSVVVFVTGLAVAVWSGIAAYHSVGLYGGALYPGFHRVWDPASKRFVLYHDSITKGGLRVRRRFEERLVLAETQVRGASDDGAIALSLSADKKTVRTGFSTANDGIINAWSTVDPKTDVMRVEVSTKRNGVIDRWERYEHGALVRVDLDTNGNGKPDRWMTYQDGIEMDTFLDINEDGKADGPPLP